MSAPEMFLGMLTLMCDVPPEAWAHKFAWSAFLAWLDGTITDTAFRYYWNAASSDFLKPAQCLLGMR